jgi:uncharacterized membrane protein HdeD (DUF308 family)
MFIESIFKLRIKPWHVVTSSPWPILSSIGVFSLLFGIALWMHSFFILSVLVLKYGVFVLVSSVAFLFFDIIF